MTKLKCRSVCIPIANEVMTRIGVSEGVVGPTIEKAGFLPNGIEQGPTEDPTRPSSPGTVAVAVEMSAATGFARLDPQFPQNR